MAHQTAEQIVKAYETVLQSKKKKYQTIFPVSLLPYPVAILKEAIKDYARDMKAAKTLDPAEIDRLKPIYTSLATFVSLEDADFVQKYQDTLNTAVDKGFALESKKFQFITNRVRSEAEHLGQEIRVFFSKLLRDNPV
jgi:hypothetical protein